MAISYGDELVTIVQIDQPLCTRVYGDAHTSPPSSPLVGCQAILGTTGTRKCFNTRVTCQDADNYNAGTLTLSFSRPQEGVTRYGYVIPSLRSLNITPLKINIGAMDENISPFGQREVVNLTFDDHQDADLMVDKYRLERATGVADQDGAYDPHERGTFWGKWIARNPYHEGYALRVYDGFMGQPLADMQVRHYIIDKINGPSNGTVTIVAKDLFSKVEERKAMAPFASNGELLADINAAVTSATLSPTGIGNLEYPASGHVAIGKEICAFTRSADVLTLTRGQLNTVAEEHKAEDRVQIVLSFVAQRAHTIAYTLLTTYGRIPSANIPYSGGSPLDEWDQEAEDNLPNLYTAYIAKPTPVSQLVGELEEQAGFTVWPDVSTNQIKLKAIVPAIGAIEHTVDDDNWIIDGSLSVKRAPEQRASEVWVYFGLINPLESVDDKKNYRSTVITADLDSEEEDQYGTASIREIYSRWIPQFGRSSAEAVGERVLSLFRDPPFRASFANYADRAGSLQLAEAFRLDTDEVQDATGNNEVTVHVPIKIFQQEATILVESQQLKFFTIPGNAREIFIDDDTNDFNLRTEHDALFGPPSDGDVVILYINTGVVVGASTTDGPALEVGEWPEGVEIQIYILGRVTGAGGIGGYGAFSNIGTFAPTAGLQGGPAFVTTFPVKVYNGGEGIFGGGGGAGGGGADTGGSTFASSGGGGGAGEVPGTGVVRFGPPYDGQTGTLLAGGAPGTPDGARAKPGGTGGGPGLPGGAGTNGTLFAGGLGGSEGYAIQGLSNISWIDADGNPSGDDGTIVGLTS